MVFRLLLRVAPHNINLGVRCLLSERENWIKDMEPAPKRRRLGRDGDNDDNKNASKTFPHSLSRSISPPRMRRTRPEATPSEASQPIVASSSSEPEKKNGTRVIKSPFELTWIRDLPEAANTDTVTLKDILGDPLIAECWNFNYLHDINFLLAAFDEDVRQSVKVNVVHGFWKKEDANRLMLQMEAEPHKNVKLHCAYMPEMYGTHHSKMLILLRHDDTAQVIIHTANMIPRDWTNMTQGMWRSPLLPLLKPSASKDGNAKQTPTIGSGQKFKVDLLNYLRAYNTKRPVCRSLVEQLDKYDFSAIKAALIASVPGRHNIHDSSEETKWGWAALKHALRTVPVQEGKSEIVIQISSIATLGPTDTWLRKCIFDSFKASENKTKAEPSFKVVFPTPDEIRRSLDGYQSGASIHTKTQSTQQAKQLQYLKPRFCHWANDAEGGQALKNGAEIKEAGRKRAAPHIKTYIRYGEKSIDWALTTSANLSKQAWGEAVNAISGEVRVASWEIGVLVWPSLFADDAKVVGTFQKDTPDPDVDETTTVVGLRIPYNLPLQSYGANENPWVATQSYHEPDWQGQMWVA